MSETISGDIGKSRERLEETREGREVKRSGIPMIPMSETISGDIGKSRERLQRRLEWDEK
ncbi:MAG: hypothetical protein K9H26_02510 [Prolixibacteraceae bacterium]|nr:hypothetical protein [Prolixibacteraceae bacterium]